MQKCVLGQADVDKGGFQPRIEVLDPALVDAADNAVGTRGTFNVELVEDPVDQESDPVLQRLGVDDELAEYLLLLAE